LIRRKLSDRHVAPGAPYLADASVEESEIIVYFRESADSASRIAAVRLLVHGNCWLQALDGVYVWPVELLQETAGAGREAFEVLPPALGEDGVEYQRTLAAPAGSCDQDELAAGNVHVNVPKVVNPGTANPEVSNVSLRWCGCLHDVIVISWPPLGNRTHS
jgi:hypothetical protein